MRNGLHGLAAKVQTVLKDDLMSGHVFIFWGRSCSFVKRLCSTGDGLCLLTKRLERGRFARQQPKRCYCPAIRKRRSGGCGRTFVMTVTRGQCWNRQPRQKMHQPAGTSVRVQRCAAGGCVRRVQRAVPRRADKRSHLLGSCPPQDQNVHVRTPSALTEETLKRICELYVIEAVKRGM